MTVQPVRVRQVAPRLVSGFARAGYRAGAPDLRAGRRVVGRDDTRLRSACRRTAAAGDDLAIGNDRAGGVIGGVLRVVQDLGLPGQLTGHSVEREDVPVGARVDDEAAVNGEVAVDVEQRERHGVKERFQIVRILPPVLPQQVAGGGVDGLDDVARVRHVHHAVIDERRPLGDTSVVGSWITPLKSCPIDASPSN